jgi:hypothetical protein
VVKKRNDSDQKGPSDALDDISEALGDQGGPMTRRPSRLDGVTAKNASRGDKTTMSGI